MTAKPLWAAMLDAYLSASCFGATVETDKAAWAAEIRAVADWLVPEISIEDLPGRFVNGCCHEQRQQLRQRLLAEADRALQGNAS